MTTRFRKILLCWGVPLLLFQGCTSAWQEPAPQPPSAAAPPASQTPGASNRRVFEGCDPVEAALRHEELVGEKVLITWAWQRPDDASTGLRVPATVLRVDPPVVAVTFDPRVVSLELYTSVWLYSGHIRAEPDGAYAVDPCSATIERGGW